MSVSVEGVAMPPAKMYRVSTSGAGLAASADRAIDVAAETFVQLLVCVDGVVELCALYGPRPGRERFRALLPKFVGVVGASKAKAETRELSMAKAAGIV
jgi:hypothetical protein